MKASNELKGAIYWLGSYVLVEKGLILIIGVLLVLKDLMILVEPYLYGYGIDHFILSGRSSGFVEFGILLVVISIVKGLLSFLSTWGMGRFGNEIIHNMRVEIIRRVLSFPLSFFERRSSGKILTRMTQDVEILGQMLTSGLLPMLSDFVLIFFTALIMFVYRWKLALFSFIPIPIFIIYVHFEIKRLRSLYADMRTVAAQLNALSQESFDRSETIKSLRLFEEMKKRFLPLNKNYLRLNLSTVVEESRVSAVVELTMTSCISTLLIGAIKFSSAVTPGEVIAFVEYIRRFFHPLRHLTQNLAVFQSSVAAASKVYNFYISDEPEVSGNVRHEKFYGKVRFENVSFSYNNRKEPVLNNINLVVNPGESIALVGNTGSGKTTAMKLLIALYYPTKGRITIDGIDINRIDKNWLRSHIGYVPQEAFVLSGKKSLKIGDMDLKSQIGLSGRIDIKSGGSNLSEGQKQLFSVSELTINNKPFIILDEATSSMDNILESKLKNLLLNSNRTVIFIAHRMGFVEMADRIYVFKDGRIVGVGSHRDLLLTNPYYADLYAKKKGILNDQ